MPDTRQRYHITIGYQNGQSIQAITYQDRKSLHQTLSSEPDEHGLVHISCVSVEGDPIDIDVSPSGILLMMHQKWTPPAQQGRPQIAVPRIMQ